MCWWDGRRDPRIPQGRSGPRNIESGFSLPRCSIPIGSPALSPEKQLSLRNRAFDNESTGHLSDTVEDPMNAPKVLLILIALTAIIVWQQFSISGLRSDLAALEANQAEYLERVADSQRRRLEDDGQRAMRAVCVLTEFARSDRDPGPEQKLTIRSAEFELLYFTQQYLSSVSTGRPMADFLLAYEQGWPIRGEYYPALPAISIALDSAKESTKITSDGNVRHMFERISRWLNKRSETAESNDHE